MLSSGHDTGISVTDSQQLWLSIQQKHSQNPDIDKEGTFQVHPLTEELSRVDSSQTWESHFFEEDKVMVVCPCSCGCSHTHEHIDKTNQT